MRWMRGLTVTLIAAAVVIGPPALVAAWLHSGVHRPDRDDMTQLLQDPLGSSIGLLILLGVAVVPIWLAIAVIVIRHATTRLRSGWRRLRNLPLPTPAQATAGSMAGAAMPGLPGLHAGITTPPPAPVPALVPHSHEPPGAGTDAGDPGQVTPGGVTLPDSGGWLPDPVAHLVTAAAGALWLRRRRTYLPTPGRHGPRDDTDLQPLPTTVNAVLAATAELPATDAPDPTLTADALPSGALC
jgi:hypothetical protein